MNYLLDTNILVRHLTGEPKEQARKAKTIIQAIEAREIEVELSILVVNETLWIMENYYKVPREKFIPPLLEIFNLKNIQIMETSKRILVKTLTEFQETSIDFTDLYLRNTADPARDTVISFDKHFDRFELNRQENF